VSIDEFTVCVQDVCPQQLYACFKSSMQHVSGCIDNVLFSVTLFQRHHKRSVKLAKLKVSR